MAMDPLAGVRLRARGCHADALARTGGDRTASALILAAAGARDLVIAEFEPGTRFAPGVDGRYDRVGLLIGVVSGLPRGARELVIAHELGHHELHDEAVAEVVVAAAGPDGQDPVGPMEGYSSRVRHEVAAETFAHEFLCPTDKLRADLLAGRSPDEIADALGLPPVVVVRQALRALLLPEPRPPSATPRRDAALDDVQRRAAEWGGGPLFVQAGPGTGKTSTLVGRIRHLLATGVPTGSILCLTFSRAAADEVRGRVAAAAPEAAPSLWVGTFHAFGLEVLREFHARAGLPPNPRVVDRDAALALIEDRIAGLPLRRHRDLRDPAIGLVPVLRAVERCKGSMVTPRDYAAAARSAAPDGGGEVVEAALEVAAIYAAYQDALESEGALDLGDLVMRATALLEDNDDIATHWGRRFRHVLVDEYQDVDVAGARLLASLCGPGTSAWFVGDGRQAIHRFRGARPDAVGTFADAFGGSTLALDRNYRSRPEVIASFAAFSSTMRGGAGAWTADRGPGGDVRVASAPSLAGEAVAIRDRIATLRDAGVGHADQAVLARTHLCLDRIGGELERLGVPVLHLGDPFRRPEIRDLLALLAAADGELVALVRAATLAPFSVPGRDAAAAVRWAASRGLGAMDLLRCAGGVPGIDAAAAAGLSRLRRFLERLGPGATSWSVLIAFLLEDGRGWLAPMLVDGGAHARMRLVAIHRLLGLAAAEDGAPGHLTARVRRIVALGEGRTHGVVPPEGDDGTSVRAMTIHAAKGLEFGAVHVAMATARHLPSPRRPERCPPPPDLAHLAMTPADHDAEERALAFVALSRARDHLTLSHARRYTGGYDVRPSPYLARIGPVAATRHGDPPTGAVSEAPVGDGPTRGVRGRHHERHLRAYTACPASHRLGVIDGLEVAARPSAHHGMHRSVSMATGQLECAAALTGTAPGHGEADAALAVAWAAHGPIGHRLESFHRGIARRAVVNIAGAIAGETGAVHHHETWEVDVGPGTVEVRPDRIVEHPWGRIVVQTLVLEGPGGPPVADALHALLWLGARRRFPDHAIAVEVFDAEADEAHAVDVLDPEDAVMPYADAIAGIAGGRFPARPGPGCARCPYLLVCDG